IKAYDVLISLFLILFVCGIFILLKKYFNQWLALVLALAIAYNPVILSLKKEVLSDIPYAAVALIALLSFNSKNRSILLSGLLIGLALSIRGVGISLFIALLLSAALFRQSKSLVILLIGTAIYFLLNKIIFNSGAGDFFSFYHQAYKDENVAAMVKANISYYYEVLKYYFNQGDGIWRSISQITQYVFIFGFVAGMVYKLAVKRNPELVDLAFISYAIIILVYPYQAGGFRFLVPIIPMI